ncbi:MAG: glycoside hydrolase family 31 protein, partial [Rikenellaceae bacterium]
MNKIFIILSVLFCAASCCDSQKTDGQVVWVEEFPSVWSATLGEPEQFNLLNATGVAPRSEVLSGGNAASLPFDQSKIKYTVHNSRTCITISISADEQIYGLGLNFKSLSQRGAIKQLHMDHYSNSDNGRTHAPVPFFVSSQGYGILFNSARYIDAWVTSAVRTDSENPPVATDRTTNPHWSAQPYSDNMEILIPADGVELVLFSGETMMDVVASFNLYTGGGFIPPKWGLGFWQRTPTAFSDGDALEEADSFVEHDFPLDVIGLEPGWHSYAYPCSFEWDSVRFANAPEFVEQMQQRNIKVNLWANPYLSPESSLFEPMNQYVGSHTVWCGTVPDYTMPQAQKLFQDHITKHQLQMGVSGYKIDEVDGYDCWLWPDVATFPSGLDGEQMRSVYGNLVMKTILDSYRAQNQRTYGMVRGVNAGGSSFPFVIYNDNYSHQDFITAISSASFIGVQWTPEVRASGSSQEWLRRMQTTCFSPLALINAWADGTKPWS